MPEARLERTRRAYDRVIDMGPMGCKFIDVGTPDHAALNAIWMRKHTPRFRIGNVLGTDELTGRPTKAAMK